MKIHVVKNQNKKKLDEAGLADISGRSLRLKVLLTEISDAQVDELLLLSNEVGIQDLIKKAREAEEDREPIPRPSHLMAPKRLQQKKDETKASLQNVPTRYFGWMLAMSKGDPEPLPEIISMVLAYMKYKGNLRKALSVGNYPSVGSLRQAIEGLSAAPKAKEDLTTIQIPENDLIYSGENWVVYYPKSQVGSVSSATSNKIATGGVQWCTAATTSTNLFETYSGRYKIHLYYCFKKGGNTFKDPNDKICVGLVKEDDRIKIMHNSNATVNAVNTDLSEQELASIFAGRDRRSATEGWRQIREKIFGDARKRPNTAFNEMIKSMTPEMFEQQVEMMKEQARREHYYDKWHVQQQALIFVRNPAISQEVVQKYFEMFVDRHVTDGQGGRDLYLDNVPLEYLPDWLVSPGGFRHVSMSPGHGRGQPRNKMQSLPDNFNISGNLSLGGFSNLPKGLVIGGSLSISDSYIQEIPGDLKVGGDISIDDNATDIEFSLSEVKGNLRITGVAFDPSLPDGLKVGGSLNLERCGHMKSLPANLTVGGDLRIRLTQILDLPANLTVGGSVQGFGNTSFSSYERRRRRDGHELPDTEKQFSIGPNVRIGESIRSKNRTIKHIGEGLTVGGALNLDRCTFLSPLPPDLKAGSLFLRGSRGLETLPKDLEVETELSLRNTKAPIKIPEAFKLDGSLNLEGVTVVGSLSDGLAIQGDLKLAGSSIRTLPENLIVGGVLDLSNSKVESIPQSARIGSKQVRASRLPSLQYPRGGNYQTVDTGIILDYQSRLKARGLPNLEEVLSDGATIKITGGGIRYGPRALGRLHQLEGGEEDGLEFWRQNVYAPIDITYGTDKGRIIPDKVRTSPPYSPSSLSWKIIMRIKSSLEMGGRTVTPYGNPSNKLSVADMSNFYKDDDGELQVEGEWVEASRRFLWLENMAKYFRMESQRGARRHQERIEAIIQKEGYGEEWKLMQGSKDGLSENRKKSIKVRIKKNKLFTVQRDPAL